MKSHLVTRSTLIISTVLRSFRRSSFQLFFALSLAAMLTSLRAQETWNLGAGGSWNAATSWNPQTIPNSPGVSVTFNGNATGSNVVQTGNRTVTLDAAQTVGSIL